MKIFGHLMTTYEHQFKKIEQYLKKQNVKIIKAPLKDGPEFCSTNMHVSYNPRTSPEKQIFELLHEAGHFLVHKHSRFRKKYSYSNKSLWDERHKKSMRYRTEVLREEFDAYERGYNLSKRLNLNINYDEYQKFAAKNIFSYCDWISERDWSRE